MTEPLQPPIRKKALAAANYHVAVAGIVLANAGVPKDSEELKLLREVLRLLKARAPENLTVKKSIVPSTEAGNANAGAKALGSHPNSAAGETSPPAPVLGIQPGRVTEASV